ncbi:MAG: sulfite exporter TauE/SafE family protein [Bacteroidales bacterium]
MIEIIAPLMLGLMGSFHCVGMCGPIALVLPLKGKSWFVRLFNGTAYNLGRTVTYGLMGFIFGLAGAGLSLAGFQRNVSIAMGIVMILTVVVPWIFGGSFSAENLGAPLLNRIRGPLTRLMQSGTTGALFLIGLLNGLLPCGLVYVALAGAIGTGSLGGSVVFMVIFGLGTLPLMLLVTVAGNIVGKSLKARINQLIPVVVILVGILFILRGLNLGIPYISPRESKLHVPVKQEHHTSPGCCSSKPKPIVYSGF